MQADPKVLRQRVFRCEECSESGFGFSRIDADAALSKFPPTIGSSGDAPLLFIGTNPRISNSNRELYTEIMRSPESFDLLAQDVWRGRSYLRFGEPGHHYDLHIAIARKAIPGRPFASAPPSLRCFSVQRSMVDCCQTLAVGAPTSTSTKLHSKYGRKL